MIKPKKIFEFFICFWKCFCVLLVFWKFFQKAKSILLKNSSRSIFVSMSRVRYLAPQSWKWGSLFSFLLKFYTECFMSSSQETASHETCPVLWGILRVTRKYFVGSYLAKWVDFQFLKGHTMAVFQTFIFASFMHLSNQNTIFTQISTKTPWISSLSLL